MESAYKLEAVSVSMEELELAWQRKYDAAQVFKTLADAVALKAGMDAAALKTYVTAKMQDKLDQKQRQQEQLSLLMDMGG